MGLTSSKTFEMFSSENETPATPCGRRFVNAEFDPRSPSGDISRTPIQVGKGADSKLTDPRSPTEGIDRTPIYTSKGIRKGSKIFRKSSLTKTPSPSASTHSSPSSESPQKKSASTPVKDSASPVAGAPDADPSTPATGGNAIMNDPRSPSEGITRTPIYELDVTESFAAAGRSVCMTPGGNAPEDEREASQESGHGDKPASHYGSTSDLLPGATLTYTTLTNKGSKKKKRSKSLFKIHTSPPKENSTSTPPKPQSAKNKLSDKNSNTRDQQSGVSPLGSRNTDYNSPRAIVQRKQTDKLSMMRVSGGGVAGGRLSLQLSGSPRYQVMQEDKENIQ